MQEFGYRGPTQESATRPSCRDPSRGRVHRWTSAGILPETCHFVPPFNSPGVASCGQSAIPQRIPGQADPTSDEGFLGNRNRMWHVEPETAISVFAFIVHYRQTLANPRVGMGPWAAGVLPASTWRCRVWGDSGQSRWPHAETFQSVGACCVPRKKTHARTTKHTARLTKVAARQGRLVANINVEMPYFEGSGKKARLKWSKGTESACDQYRFTCLQGMHSVDQRNFIFRVEVYGRTA